MQEERPGVRRTTLCLAEPSPGPHTGSPAPGVLEAEEEEQRQQLVTALRSCAHLVRKPDPGSLEDMQKSQTAVFRTNYSGVCAGSVISLQFHYSYNKVSVREVSFKRQVCSGCLPRVSVCVHADSRRWPH